MTETQRKGLYPWDPMSATARARQGRSQRPGTPCRSPTGQQGPGAPASPAASQAHWEEAGWEQRRPPAQALHHGMGASQAAASWPQAGCFTKEKIKPKKLNLTNKTSPTPEGFCFSGAEMERQTNKWAASCSLAHPHTATTGRTRTHPAEPLPAVSQAHSSRDKWECSRTQTRPPIRNGAPQAAS